MQPAVIQAHELLKLLYRRPKVAVAVRIAMLMQKKGSKYDVMAPEV